MVGRLESTEEGCAVVEYEPCVWKHEGENTIDRLAKQ